MSETLKAEKLIERATNAAKNSSDRYLAYQDLKRHMVNHALALVELVKAANELKAQGAGQYDYEEPVIKARTRFESALSALKDF